MRLWSHGLLMALGLISASAAVPTRPPEIPNLDFEQGPTGELPPGWSAGGALRSGFRVLVTGAQPHGGSQCVEIRRDSIAFFSRELGTLSRKIDATPYRGRRFQLSGWVRFEPSRAEPHWGSARMWARVLRPGGRGGFNDYMDAHPVRSSEWTRVRIIGDVALDADSIAFGGALEACGAMWADDLSLELLGPIGEGDRPPAPLADRSTENLVAFGRLVGYVRYFHPSDQAASVDWDSFVIAGVDQVEGARSPMELERRLEGLFRPLAPTLRLSTRPLSSLTPSELLPPGEQPARLVGWWHHGWADGSSTGIYYGRRISKSIGAPADSILPIGSEVNLDLGGGVWCSMPMTLYADERGTLPRGQSTQLTPRRPNGWIPSGNDRDTRLADLILFWNVAQHFYPYFDVVDTDWPAQLPLTLRRAAMDHDGASFETTLRRLVAQLHDGHGSVNSPYGDPRPMPLFWTFAEGQLVVVHADSTIADRVHPGDVVTAIQGRPVSAWVKEAEAIKCAATPQWLRVRVAEALQVLPGVDTVAVDLRSPAGVMSRAWVPRRWGALMKSPRPDSVAEIRPNVMYLDLDRITDADFQRALPRIVEAKGVIFDLRGYPSRLSPIVLAHLIDSTITSARWNIPVITRPDHREMSFEFSNWPVQPASPPHPGSRRVPD
ncbi:MAG: hypothetical protein HYR74_12610 [Candidatus Eisenbacteria bacterium]|nr:hypothetical protein [Candidatus Eisenbacteria bacterium]